MRAQRIFTLNPEKGTLERVQFQGPNEVEYPCLQVGLERGGARDQESLVYKAEEGGTWAAIRAPPGGWSNSEASLNSRTKSAQGRGQARKTAPRGTTVTQDIQGVRCGIPQSLFHSPLYSRRNAAQEGN